MAIDVAILGLAQLQSTNLFVVEAKIKLGLSREAVSGRSSD
jgi:hypothetical protein